MPKSPAKLIMVRSRGHYLSDGSGPYYGSAGVSGCVPYSDLFRLRRSPMPLQMPRNLIVAVANWAQRPRPSRMPSRTDLHDRTVTIVIQPIDFSPFALLALIGPIVYGRVFALG